LERIDCIGAFIAFAVISVWLVVWLPLMRGLHIGKPEHAQLAAMAYGALFLVHLLLALAMVGARSIATNDLRRSIHDYWLRSRRADLLLTLLIIVFIGLAHG
jgi:hypothetical protein